MTLPAPSIGDEQAQSRETLLITQEDVADMVTLCGLDALMDRTIERLRAALRAPLDDVEQPLRAGFSYEGPPAGLVEWMPCRVGGQRVTMKIVGYHPSNPERGLPTVLATALSHEVGTGHLRAIAEGVFLTSLRTGAASAIATEVLAAPGSRTVGLVGAGCQAVTQLHALSRVLHVERALVHDVDPAVAASFPRRVVWMGIPVRVAPLAEVEREADVLCTATSVPPGAGPVIGGRDLAAHVHVNAVGSDFPGKRELPTWLLREALVCPDFEGQAIVEGECQALAHGDIGPDLAAIVADPEHVAGWRTRRTVFDSTGIALEDDVAMEVLIETAHELGLGTGVAFEHLPADPHDPYDFSRQGRAVQAEGRAPEFAAAARGGGRGAQAAF